MSEEQKKNKAQSTLDSTITTGATSLTVASATSFPTVPQFRLGIENELLLVTAISGATFTVTRGIEGTVAIGHNGGKSVTLLETEAGQVRFQRDWSNPFWGVGKPMQLLDGSGVTLTASDFTNINFTLGTKTDVSGGSILLEQTVHSTGDISSIVRTAPAPPWIITIGFIANLVNESGDFPSCGMIVRDSTTGEIYEIRLVTFDTGTAIQVNTYATPTSSAVAKSTGTTWSGGSGVVWAQIEDDNTDLIFRVSTDGFNFRQLFKEPRLTFLTPDQVGFAIDSQGSGALIDSMSTLVAWDEA